MPSLNPITIFGGTGFIGRHVIRRLARTGAIIRVPTRDPEKALPLKPMGDVGQIVPFACSLRNDDAVAEAIGRSETVINLIGILHKKGRDTFQTIHVETAARIARLAKQNGAQHFVHMSALGASDQSSSSYARSKAAGERAVRTFFPGAVLIRPSIVFGPEDNFFNLFATLARFLPILPLIGGGVTKFQPVYVGDVAEAVSQSLRRPEAQGACYELGGPQIYSFRELLELMLRVTRQKRGFVNLPWPMAKVHAGLHELLPLPRPLITRDQVELLKTDNVIRDPQTKTLGNLGISPTALEVILPTYLGRFRKNQPREASS
jgi:NADH dehydrogenase